MEEDQEVKIFIDTNILISGIFFTGNESRLLSLPGIELFTSDVAVMELKEVVARKFASLKVESKRIAFQEVEKALGDIRIIGRKESMKYLMEATKLVNEKNDREILAAVLSVKPDYFITGDKHFHTDMVNQQVRVKHTNDVLRELKLAK
jgi:predicted nucleic acid-binding protein